MKDDLMSKIMEEVQRKMDEVEETGTVAAATGTCGLTEYVGTAIGNTIGLVIANVDSQLHEMAKIDPKFRSVGILSARTGAGPQIFAADEAIKATNCEMVMCELPRDTEGGAGHGSIILFGAEDVSDARRAVEVALKELDRTFGDVYANAAGHLEFQYTARASYACEGAFGAIVGKAFGIIVGAPAGIGFLMSDAALKSANVELLGFASPGNGGTSYSNECIIFVAGDSGAVRQCILSAKEVGLQALEALGGPAPSVTTPYI
jgi:microcompartment protein PduB